MLRDSNRLTVRSSGRQASPDLEAYKGLYEPDGGTTRIWLENGGLQVREYASEELWAEIEHSEAASKTVEAD